MKFNANLAATSLMLAAILGAAACSPPAEKAEATAADVTAASPDVKAFRIGTWDAFALRDGTLSFPNDGKTLAMGEPKAEVDALLTAAGLPTDQAQLSLQPLLVKMGERTVLFDAGAAGQMGTDNKLQASLRTAGASPEQVTDILISHAHGDHVGGLVNANGALAFPNATIRMSANEWTALQGDAQMARLVAAITPRVQTFQPNAEVVPGVTAVDVAGHTPGHSAYEIGSGPDRLLYIGDAMHHSVVSVQRPDWTIAFDGDATTAEASRRALLERVAAGNQRIYAVHFPFPGLGRIQRRDDDFVWVAEQP